jgi:alkylation response protein AidB-like acyl-CoA dehydrogenase
MRRGKEMYEYEFTEEQRDIYLAIREIAEKEIEPRAAEIDKSNEFPDDIIKILIKNGVHLLPLPEEYGGYNSVLTNCLAIEELAKVSSAASYWITVNSGCTRCLTAFTMTEPDAGSDVAAIRTTAVLDGDEYVINGEKCFISIGGSADFYTLFAKLNPEKGLKGMGVFIVDRETAGVNVDKIDEKMGQCGSATADISFNDVRVHRENMLAGEGEGMKLAFASINPTRVYVASMALGCAEGAMNYATRYAKERVAFGKKIAEFQAVQFLLAEMAMRVEVARTMLYKVASMIDRRVGEIGGYAALTKCFITEKALEVANYAMDVLGGHGYMKDHPLERIMRDIKGFHYTEGTNYINRLHIARALLEGEFST